MMDLSQNPLCRPFDFAGNPRHGILLVHGFTATPGTMLPLGKGAGPARLPGQGDLIARPRDNGGRHGTPPGGLNGLAPSRMGSTSCRRNASASVWLAFRWEERLRFCWHRRALSIARYRFALRCACATAPAVLRV